MGTELFHADRRTDRRADITKLIERACKTHYQKHNMTQIIKHATVISRSQPRLQFVHLNPLTSNTDTVVASEM
jgi:hypothetical protein